MGCEVQSTISNQQSSILGGARRQPRVILWCVDIQRNQRIIDWDISDVLLMLVFDIAGNCCGGGAQKSFYHFSSPPGGMPLLAGGIWHDPPYALIGSPKNGAPHMDGCRRGWGAGGPKDQCGIPAPT